MPGKGCICSESLGEEALLGLEQDFCGAFDRLRCTGEGPDPAPGTPLWFGARQSRSVLLVNWKKQVFAFWRIRKILRSTEC